MTKRRPLTALLIAAVLALPAYLAMGQAKATKGGEGVVVRRLIRVTWDVKALPMNSKNVVELGRWAFVRVRDSKTLKTDGSDFAPLLGTGEGLPARGYLLAECWIAPRDPSKAPEAFKVIETMANRLRELLQGEHAAYGETMETKMRDVVRTGRDARGRVQKIRKALASKTDEAARLDVDWQLELARQRLAELGRKTLEAEIEHMRKDARLAAVREQIAEHAKTPASAPAKDGAIMAQLAQILKAKHMSLQAKHMKAEQLRKAVREGAATEADLAEAEAQLAKAVPELTLAELTLRQAKLRSSAAPKLPAKLKAEQTALMIDLSVARDVLVRLQDELDQATARAKDLQEVSQRARGLSEQIEQLKTVDLPLAVKRYEKAALREAELELQRRELVAPSVTIVKPNDK